uniref:Beta-defensin 33 n=1 Tax=Balaenoptera musculus TaxID=9771 RepID=A0A8C0E319_BALMU
MPFFLCFSFTSPSFSGNGKKMKNPECEKMGGVCKHQKTHGCIILPAECKSRKKHCCRA